MVKKTMTMLSRFYLVPERDGRTDGDRFAISISRVSMLTRDGDKDKFQISEITIPDIQNNNF